MIDWDVIAVNEEFVGGNEVIDVRIVDSVIKDSVINEG